MSNAVKTALLLGVLSALLLFIGEALGGAQGLVVGFLFAVVHELRVVLVLGQDRPAHVQRAGGRARSPALQDRERLAARAGLPQPRCYVIPQPSPNAFATGRNPQHAAVAATEGILQMLERRGARRRARPRAGAREAPRHPDQLGGRDAGRRDHDDRRGFAMFFGGGRRRRSRRQQPDRAARDDDPGADRGDADSGGDLAVARVRRRRRRRAHRRQPDGLVSALRKIEAASQRRAARRQSRRRRTCSSSSRSRSAA